MVLFFCRFLALVGMIVWVGGLIGVFFTGVYGARLMRLTFYGKRSQYATEHLHTGHGEAPWVMMLPVMVLAAGTVLSGFLAIGFGWFVIYVNAPAALR